MLRVCWERTREAVALVMQRLLIDQRRTPRLGGYEKGSIRARNSCPICRLQRGKHQNKKNQESPLAACCNCLSTEYRIGQTPVSRERWMHRDARVTPREVGCKSLSNCQAVSLLGATAPFILPPGQIITQPPSLRYEGRGYGRESMDSSMIQSIKRLDRVFLP